MDGSVDQRPSGSSLEDFRADLARLALGWRSDRHLPAIAMVGLEAGLDSKALAALAGEGEGPMPLNSGLYSRGPFGTWACRSQGARTPWTCSFSGGSVVSLQDGAG
jgi:hypothetical protein